MNDGRDACSSARSMWVSAIVNGGTLLVAVSELVSGIHLPDKGISARTEYILQIHLYV